MLDDDVDVDPLDDTPDHDEPDNPRDDLDLGVFAAWPSAVAMRLQRERWERNRPIVEARRRRLQPWRYGA